VMNFEAGMRAIIRNPVILTFPIILQVIFSFGIGFLSFLGIGLFFVDTVITGNATEEFSIQFTLPIYIPLLSDLEQPLSFLPILAGDSIIWKLVIAAFYFTVVSMAMGMYLGSIKKVLVPESLQHVSTFQLGYRYFWRLFCYQI